MSFIKRIIGPDERLIGLCSVHWIYGLKGLSWLTGCMLFGVMVRSVLVQTFDFDAFSIIGNYFFWTATALGGVLFFFYFLIMISTEIALTTKRVIFKRGLIAVDVREVDLEEIKAADVNNGWLGRFLNYGYLLFDARFVTNLQLPAISDPYRFVKALNEARARVRADSMRVILDGGTDAAPVYAASGAAAQEQLGLRDLSDPRYAALSDDPRHELDEALKALVGAAEKGRPVSGGRAVRQMKPVVFDKIRLREKVKDSFHTISHYGNKY